jgi:hypothetical protein
VVGALLDAEAEDGFINNLILSVRSLIPVEALVGEVEKRNKLKMLNPFLEQLVSEGSKVGGRTGGWVGGLDIHDVEGRESFADTGWSSAGPGRICVPACVRACMHASQPSCAWMPAARPQCWLAADPRHLPFLPKKT